VGFCQRIKTDRVLYDERIFITENEPNIRLGREVPEGVIRPGLSQVEVAVVECDLVRGRGGQITDVDVTLFIDKTIVVEETTNLRGLIPFEFSFRRTFRVPLAKIADATIDPADAARAHCQIVDIAAEDLLRLTSGDTLSELLEVSIKLKIVVEDQILVMLCPHNARALAGLTVLPGNGNGGENGGNGNGPPPPP